MSLPEAYILIFQDNKVRGVSFTESGLFIFYDDKDKDVTSLVQICMTFRGNKGNMSFCCTRAEWEIHTI